MFFFILFINIIRRKAKRSAKEQKLFIILPLNIVYLSGITYILLCEIRIMEFLRKRNF